MASLRVAHLRHARRFLDRLSEVQVEYDRGGPAALAATAELKAIWSQVISAQDWSARNTEADRDAASVCRGFAAAGDVMLDIQRPVAERCRWLATSLTAAAKIGDKSAEAALHYKLGELHAEQHDCPAAHLHLTRAMTMFGEIGERSHEGFAINALGLNHMFLEQPLQAVAMFERALTVFRKLERPADQHFTFILIGQACRKLGRNEHAMTAFESALGIARELKDCSAEIKALKEMGLHFAACGDRERSREYFRLAEAAAVSMPGHDTDSKYVSDLGTLGVNILLSGDGRGLEHLTDELERFRTQGNRHGEGFTFVVLGLACTHSGHYGRARRYFLKADAIFTSLENPLGLALAWRSRGQLSQVRRKWKSALAAFRQALARFKEIGHTKGEAGTHVRLGEILAATNSNAEAALHFTEAIKLYEIIGDSQTAAAVAVTLAGISGR